MRIPLLLFVFVTLATLIIDGQTTEPGRVHKRVYRRARSGIRRPEPTPSMIEESSEEIEVACPEVTYETLLNDADAVRASLPALRFIFSQRGFTGSEAELATVYGWKQLRMKRLLPTAALSPRELINYVSGFGKLVIESSPTGASIEMDGKLLSDRTQYVAWPTPGTYRLKLSHEGYESVEDKCVVEEGKPTHFERTLQPLKQKN